MVADLVFDMGKAIVMSNDKGKFDKAPTSQRPPARLETFFTEAERRFEVHAGGVCEIGTGD
jgi:hypothetical protein